MSRYFLALATLCACAISAAQTPAPSPKPAAAAVKPAAAASAPAAAASAPANRLDRVEVNGGPTANSRRRNSTASKIVIDREELERYGDTALGDVLRRLPGVTIGGRAGRGGDIRMRGLGSGYTQILVDDERPPAGFAVEDLPPDQIERIEIYRAPTAATGARAIAGTINIILREPLQKSNHEVRFSLGQDRGEPQADFSWTRNLKWGDDLAGAISTNGALRRRFNNIDSHNRITNLDTGTVTDDIAQIGTSMGHTSSLNGNGRLRWKYSDTLSFNFTPFFAFSQNKGSSQNTAQGITSSLDPLNNLVTSNYLRDVHGDSDGHMHNVRVNLSASYRPQVGETWDLRLGQGSFKNTSNSVRRDTRTVGSGTDVRTQEDRNTTSEQHSSLSGKWSLKTAQEHQWVTGAETELSDRTQERHTLVNGVEPAGLTRFGNTLGSRNQRFATYTQDEWSPSKQWSVYAGLRYERIVTHVDAVDVLPETHNVSQVTSPLFHLLWKPEAFPKDQVRMSLTRSYRSPNLNDLIARPNINLTYPVGTTNSQTTADSAGNPDLKPELATGVDISLEHWLPTGGIVSGSAFFTELKSVIRRQVQLETVSWDTSQRWVSRPRNMAGARTMGVQFEVKARLDEMWEDAPEEWRLMLLRFNFALFKSQVQGIGGSNNRLDQQPKGSLNFGLDHRWKALGQNFGSGFNFNFVPASKVQQTEVLRSEESARRQFDAYLSWASGSVRDGINWRLSMANLFPRPASRSTEGLSTRSVASGDYQQLTESWSNNKTFRVISLRADMRF